MSCVLNVGVRLDFKSALRLLLLAESICVYGLVSSSKAYGKDKFELVFIKENCIRISLVPSKERLIMHCWTVKYFSPCYCIWTAFSYLILTPWLIGALFLQSDDSQIMNSDSQGCLYARLKDRIKQQD